MRIRATGWLVLLALGGLTLLPGCPFFTRRDGPAASDDAPPAAAEAGHDHAEGEAAH
jgi:hypothetical protein